MALEARAEERHEFLAGQLDAMAGGTPEHAALATALAGELREALRSKPRRVYSSDRCVRIQASGLTTYPDLSVVCGRLETDGEDSNAIVNPVVLVSAKVRVRGTHREVLSEASEAYDRAAKAAHYRRIPSLREYVLVSQREPLVEVYRLNERGRFELFESRAGEFVELASIGATFSVDSIFENPLLPEAN